MQYSGMWCIDCRQDVVGLKSQEAGRYQCPRCKGVICDRMQATAPAVAASPAAVAPDPDAVQRNDLREPSPLDILECGDSSPLSFGRQLNDLPEPPPLDTWELDEQLRHAARLLGLKAGHGAAPARARLDPAQPTAPGWHRAGPRRATTPSRARAHGWQRLLGSLLGSASTWLGVTALTCGASLLGWAEFSSRAELQTIGLVIAIGGTLMLALGMTLRLGQSEPRFAVPPTKRRIDPKSPSPRHGPHTRRPVGQHAERAA